MSIDSIACDLYVDITGDNSTAPGSRLSDALEVLQAGQILMVVCKKQALINDIAELCGQRDLRLIDQGEADDMLYFRIQLPCTS